jgi:hypothetical protein
MINLVFTHTIRANTFTNIVTQLPQLIQASNSPPGIENVSRRCPAIIRIRWVYLVDLVGFILSHHDDA